MHVELLIDYVFECGMFCSSLTEGKDTHTGLHNAKFINDSGR